MTDERYTLPSIVNLDMLFISTPNARVINDLVLDNSPEEIIDTIFDVSNDRSDNVAACQCGELNGNYYKGVKCSVCNTTCEAPLFNVIRNELWLEIPATMKPVLNPQAYRVLSNWLGNTNRRSILGQLVDMTEPSEPIPGTPFFSAMGFNWLYDNFKTFMEYYYYHHPSKLKRATAYQIKLFIDITGEALWTTKLPILSKVVQPIVRQSDGVRYVDPNLRPLMSSIFTLSSLLLSEKMMRFSTNHIERNFGKVYFEFVNYIRVIQTERLPKKPSLLRKHIFGSRYHMTGRSVIVPIVTPHDMDEIHLPWKLGVVLYKYHIMSVLVNRFHMSPMQAYNKASVAINLYDHDIDLIIQQLIVESPHKGLPILINRNPTLKLGGIQLVFVTKVKPSLKENPVSPIVDDENIDDGGFAVSLSDSDDSDDSEMLITPDSYLKSMNYDSDENREILSRLIDDCTIGISPMICPALNADFDGDEASMLVLFENSRISQFDALRPVHRALSSSAVEIDAGDLALSSQQYCCLSGWINDLD